MFVPRLDPGSDGQQQLVYGTREGDLFDWRVQGDPARSDWSHYRHDERNTGQYGLDTQRPSTVAGARAVRIRGGAVLTLRAPGDDWTAGRAARYEVRWSRRAAGVARGGRVAVRARPAAAGRLQRLRLRVPSRARYLAVRAIDNAGNRGALVTVRLRRSG